MGIISKICKMRKRDYIALLKIVITCIPGKIYGRMHNNIWLISERETDARDNGYWLFRYVRINHPEIEVYYPINTSCDDYNKIKEFGNVIEFGSLKHHFLFWACKKNISAHIGNGMPNGPICFNLSMWGLYSCKNIFLQHGITCNNAEFLYADNTNVDLFISAAAREYNYIVSKFGYKKEQVALTGFCRYDNLNNICKKENQILIMPTWRYWLYPENPENKKNDEEFMKSTYYNEYQSLLDDDEFIDFVEENELKVVFYVHHDLQQFSHLFHSKTNSIIIGSEQCYDVQNLLKESAVLITDYSSIFFDFAYMKKPLAYFQFDKEEYRQKQYNEGYFSYDKDGFGPLYMKKRDVVKWLIESYTGGRFINSERYIERIENFYAYSDNKNTQRVYEAIMRF